MRADDLDRVLSSEEAIEPSAGFVGAVMAAVQSEALVPPPLAFPWRRVAWGIAALPVLLLAAWTVPPFGGMVATFGDAVGRAAGGLGSAHLAWLSGTLLGSYLLVRLSQRLGPREV